MVVFGIAGARAVRAVAVAALVEGDQPFPISPVRGVWR